MGLFFHPFLLLGLLAAAVTVVALVVRFILKLLF